MPILPGKRLGPYEILSPIGAGGMGEVYKARDTRLDRIVAIKVLPTHLADRSELRERFEREAKTIASLNHPHICTLHDIGHQDGTDYLVMEYLEGETLAKRLQKGALPMEQVLPYAIEISDALDKAHRKGITHRDLKPGNIMLTKSGTKLLDFGLAKLKQEVAPAIPDSQLPTMKSAVTAEGTILGTLQYMAPEQVEGKNDEIDARTDIFAFGAVVYEMATGNNAFEGKTSASVMGAIMHLDPPPMSSLQPVTPSALDRVVKRCLAKEPDERWQSANDLTNELKWISEGGSQTAVPATVVTSRKNRERVAWLIATIVSVIFVGVLALGVFVYLRRAPEQAGAVRFSVLLPERSYLAFASTNVTPLALSPDGQRMAFVATTADGKSPLWLRSLDTLTPQELPGTDGALFPFWSPDNRFLGFFAGGKLKKIDLTGGPPITLCDAPNGRGATWSRDGVIIFAPDSTTGLQRVSAAGGMPSAATVLAQDEADHRNPFFLPDGRHFLYRAVRTGGGSGRPIYVASLDSSERKLLFDAETVNVLFAQGHLLFLRNAALMAQPFDTQHLALTGEALPIAEEVQTQGDPPVGIFSASENGALAYQTVSGANTSQLIWFDRTGKQISVLGDSAQNADAVLSPDGTRVSLSIPDQTGKGRDIWLYDVAHSLKTRFTFDHADEEMSLWSPDGSQLVFNSGRKGHLDLYQKVSSGAGTEELLLEDNLEKHPSSWSPDGRFILYRASGGPTGNDLFVLPLFGDRKPFSFLNTKFNEYAGQFSPNGRWIAYFSDESGRNEVYVAPFPGPGGKWQVSSSGGTSPRWRRDGNEIFYVGPDKKLMAVAVNGKGSTFEVGAVRALFQTRLTALRYGYDVSADGQRFLINTLPEQAVARPITVVLNWQAELKK
jgi:eukaryotic-like serine/threonine-protein kinase